MWSCFRLSFTLGGVPNNYITLDGLSFIGEGIQVVSNAGNMSHWTVQNCDFKYTYNFRMDILSG